MKSIGRHQGRTAALVLSVILVIAAAPPAPAGPMPHRQLFATKKFMRDGVTYTLKIEASEYGPGMGDTVDVTISRTKNPAGLAKATQAHEYTFGLADSTVTGTGLSQASVDTGDQLGKFGRINIDFSATDPLETKCNGNRRIRRGALDGTVVFKPQSSLLGRVRATPGRARLESQDGLCPSPCPTHRVIAVSAPEAFPSLYVRKRAGADVATQSFYFAVHDAPASITRTVFARVPARKVRINDTLTGATVSTVPGTFLSGEMTFSNGGKPSIQDAQCGDHSVRMTRRAVEPSGSITAHYFIGPDTEIDSTADAAIHKIQRL